MGEAAAERLAENEIFLREVNQRIAAKTAELAGDRFSPTEQFCDFLCACGRLDCSALVSLTIADFEHAHADDDCFVVVPGHENAEIEEVVTRTGNYVVVKKTRGSKPKDLT